MTNIFERITKQTLYNILNTYIRPTMEYRVQAHVHWLSKGSTHLQFMYHRTTPLAIRFWGHTIFERLHIYLVGFLLSLHHIGSSFPYIIPNKRNHHLEAVFNQCHVISQENPASNWQCYKCIKQAHLTFTLCFISVLNKLLIHWSFVSAFYNLK